ncbi:hypothetical protein DVS28_a1419 [Euzebya pacifica]|jgi:hypothetical protein|uniref:Uncharacterized protein n=1 Tax=Euzebya pacifica TaxID=1608957 RepID=A0A346XV71_9ACTN|nr:hypothetical protein [Euzebya pacifica]AXV06118.1 hypothetical protein DVS28_a1419 [Euzebya pacifica]
MSAARRRRGKGGSRGRRRGKKKEQVGFWGEVDKLPPAKQDVRITSEAAAVVHSLGVPPLPGHEVIATHYFSAVYERAVQLSGALAAAGGLIQPEELLEEFTD